jgi:hypothetical protein
MLQGIRDLARSRELRETLREKGFQRLEELTARRQGEAFARFLRAGLEAR